jgi:hypothetical protein
MPDIPATGHVLSPLHASSWSLFRYVPWRKVDRYLAAGWIASDALTHTHHGRHAVLMRACVCNPNGDAP